MRAAPPVATEMPTKATIVSKRKCTKKNILPVDGLD